MAYRAVTIHRPEATTPNNMPNGSILKAIDRPGMTSKRMSSGTSPASTSRNNQKVREKRSKDVATDMMSRISEWRSDRPIKIMPAKGTIKVNAMAVSWVRGIYIYSCPWEIELRGSGMCDTAPPIASGIACALLSTLPSKMSAAIDAASVVKLASMPK